MNISIIGTGYVGLSTGIAFCLKGHKVKFYDINKNKIQSIIKGKIPFFEDGIEKLVKNCVKDGSANFTFKLEEALDKAEIIFICVDSPICSEGISDLTNLKEACIELREKSRREIIIVIKTTINPYDYMEIKELLNGNVFHIAVNPEFLREGSALKDSLNPYRIVVGTEDKIARKKLEKLYSSFESAKLFTDPLSAIMIKYASNSFLAVKISFINEIANLCDRIGANIDDVATGIGLDPRIGREFLNAGIGFGGSCLPKDSKNLVSFSKRAGAKTTIVQKAYEVNRGQFNIAINRLIESLKDVKGKNIGIFGLSFKGGTDDLRESVSLKIISHLRRQGALVKAHDYASCEKAKEVLKGVFISDDVYKVAKGCDALIIATDWLEYREIDWKRIKKMMNGRLVIDGRNILNADKMKKTGFIYKGIGRI